MSDFKVYCLEGRVFGITRQEKERLLAAMNNRRGQARWIDQAGNQMVLDKIVTIEVDEFDVQTPRDTHVVTNQAEPQADPTEDDTGSLELEKKRAEFLEEMKAKSSCTHEDQVIHYQNVSTKSGESKRYFPVCDFCGQRLRFIKADSLTEEQKAEAVLWTES
jgi:hypothetical protein